MLCWGLLWFQSCWPLSFLHEQEWSSCRNTFDVESALPDHHRIFSGSPQLECSWDQHEPLRVETVRSLKNIVFGEFVSTYTHPHSHAHKLIYVHAHMYAPTQRYTTHTHKDHHTHTITLLGCIIVPISNNKTFFSKSQSLRDFTILSRRGIQKPLCFVSCVCVCVQLVNRLILYWLVKWATH